MKAKFLFSLLLRLAMTTFGQGQINLDNLANSSTSPTATSNGLFFTCEPGNPFILIPINHDFNVSFYGGSDANS